MSKPYSEYPNASGFYGDYGGQYVSELLMPLITDLTHLFNSEINTAQFQDELHHYHHHFIGRPSPFILPNVCRIFVAGLEFILNVMS